MSAHLYSDLIKGISSLSFCMVPKTSKHMCKVYKVSQSFTEKWRHALFKKRGGKGMALQSALSRLRTGANCHSLPPTEGRLNSHVVSAVRKHSLLEEQFCLCSPMGFI